MRSCLFKSVLLYFIIITMLIIIKPQIFYYDNNRTKLKKWNLYNETKNMIDLCSFHNSAAITAIICYFICNNM